MSKYTIVARPDKTGFDVAIQGSNGVRQSILGFQTEASAEDWIRQDQRLNLAADPFSLSRRTFS